MPKKNLLTLLEYTPDEIRGVLSLAKTLKKERRGGDSHSFSDSAKGVMAGKTTVMVFDKPSLRTRISFETAIHELGGHVINLASESVGMGTRESIEDVARNLERIVHLVVMRTSAHETVSKLAEFCSIPVINALTDLAHPCQALAFGLTVQEARPDQKQFNVTFVGDGNNVCASIMVLCAQLGYNFTIACPTGYEPNADMTGACQKICASTGGTITVTNDMYAAVKRADAIYTDVWTSMGQEAEIQKRQAVFHPYQINAELLKHAPNNVLVTHCLPAKRGEEITSDVLDSAASVAYDEAENRLHVQKAVIVKMFGGADGV